MSFYFRADGSVNLTRLTATSGFFFTLYTWTFLLGIASVHDEGIPLLQKGSVLFGDKVLYSKLKPGPRHVRELHNKVIAVKNPFKPG